MKQYNIFSINQLKFKFLVDEGNKREKIQSINIKHNLFWVFYWCICML